MTPLAEMHHATLDAEIDALFLGFDLQKAKSLDRSLRRLADTVACREHLEQMRRLCVLYAYFADPVDGYSVAGAAVRLARRLGNADDLRKVLTARASLRRMAGDVNSAIEDNVEAYALARESGDAIAIPSALSNLIFALSMVDLDDLALRMAEPALVAATAEEPVGFSQVNAVTILMVNTADLLLWREPRRARRLSIEVERLLVRQLESVAPVERIQLVTRMVGALTNQLISSVNLNDRASAQGALEKLNASFTEGGVERVCLASEVAMAAFDARFEDRRRGIGRLKELSDSGADEVAIDAFRRLIELYEWTGATPELVETLRLLHARMQRKRRTVNLEELRRIEALDLAEEFGELEGVTAVRLASFNVSAEGLDDRLAAKLRYLEGIAVTAELREGSEANRGRHIYRVGRLCSELSMAIGCSPELQWLAEIAGRLHDIGKCAIPDTTVLHSAALTDGMKAVLREHADYGARLIADADEPRLVQVVAGVRHHHERFDGSGYPSGLKGSEIPLLSRVVSICECFDAMLQSRTFRSSKSVSTALREVERCAGSQFDPELAAAFVKLVRRLQREEGDLIEYLGQQSNFSQSVRTFESVERLTADGRSSL